MAEVSTVAGKEPSLVDSPNIEVAHVTVANTGDYYISRKFAVIKQAWVQCNHTVSDYSDEFYSVELDTSNTTRVTIHIAGSDTASVPCTIVLAGEP